MSETNWFQDEAQCREMITLHGSAKAAAEAWGICVRRVQRWAKKHQIGAEPAPYSAREKTAASATISDTQALIDSGVTSAEFMTPDELLVLKGLSPAEWSYSASMSAWEAQVGDGRIETLHRLTINATKRPETLLWPESSNGWTPPPAKRRKKSKSRPRTIALFSDPHFPKHEPALIEASIAWLEDTQPDEIVILGDISDGSPFARHRKNPRTHVTVAEHQRGTYQGLARWRNAVPDARIRLITGNHDAWWLQRLRELMPDFEQLREHPESDKPMLTMRQVFALDELRIDHVEPAGEYHDDTILIAPDLVALHGVKGGRDAAVKEQAIWEGASVCQGHAHKWQITGITKRLPGGGETQRFALNVPSMSLRDLGYSHAHDVAQGWMTLSLWPDGLWVPEMATFNPQSEAVLWRDGRWG